MPLISVACLAYIIFVTVSHLAAVALATRSLINLASITRYLLPRLQYRLYRRHYHRAVFTICRHLENRHLFSIVLGA